MATVQQLSKQLTERPSEPESSDFQIRTYGGPEDIGPWLELRSAAFARQRVGVRQWTPADFEAEFLGRWWWQPERMWLAESGPENSPQKQVVGAVMLAMRGEGEQARPVVHWLMVHPGWRRRGIARALTTQLEARAWDLGFRQVWLETHAQWAEAAAFYESLCYVARS